MSAFDVLPLNTVPPSNLFHSGSSTRIQIRLRGEQSLTRFDSQRNSNFFHRFPALRSPTRYNFLPPREETSAEVHLFLLATTPKSRQLPRVKSGKSDIGCVPIIIEGRREEPFQSRPSLRLSFRSWVGQFSLSGPSWTATSAISRTSWPRSWKTFSFMFNPRSFRRMRRRFTAASSFFYCIAVCPLVFDDLRNAGKGRGRTRTAIALPWLENCRSKSARHDECT